MTGAREAAVRTRRDAIVELWRQGLSTAVIAATLGLSIKTVHNDVQRARKSNPDAVPRRERRPLTAEQCQEICVRKAEGQSGAAIARTLGISHTCVYRSLRKAAMAKAGSYPRPTLEAIGPHILAMWEIGHTARAIADRLGLARVDPVYEAIRRGAAELRRQKDRRARVRRMLGQVAALRQQKRSHREIACELGITLSMVNHYVQRGYASGVIARRRPILRRGPIVTDAQTQGIIALNAAGNISGVEIARRFSIHKNTVYRVLRLAGVTPSVVARRQQLQSKIVPLWEAGWKSEAIADFCGTTVRYVRGAANQAARKNPALRRQAPQLSATEIERIAALRREGCYSGREIAELLNLNRSTVTSAISKLAQSEPDLALDRRLIPKNRVPEVLLLMAQGLPPALIAERFGVGRRSMYALLYKLRRLAKTRGRLVKPGVERQPLPGG